jgi:hypothetical protein
MISSRDSSALLYLHSRLPGVTMLFSVAGPDAVHQLKSDSALQKAIGGVSVFHGLVDANLVNWVHAHRLVILAWTVNDSETFNQLVRLGVDGITTDNLAILQALRRSTPTRPGDGATAPGTRRAAMGRQGQSDRLADLVRRTAAGRHVDQAEFQQHEGQILNRWQRSQRPTAGGYRRPQRPTRTGRR